MAVAGGVQPSRAMQIVDGKLAVSDRVVQRVGVVSDLDTVIARLFDGKEVAVSVYGDLVDRVQRTVEMALQGKK